MRKSALLLLTVCLFGCKSPIEKIDAFAAEDDFAGALAYLVEKKVAPTVSAELDRKDDDVKKLLEAKDLYQKKVEVRYGGLAETAFSSGRSRAALVLAEAALARCPWSYKLQQLKANSQARCARLDKAIFGAGELAVSDALQLWAYLAEFKPDLKFAADDERFKQALRTISAQIAKFESNGLRVDLKLRDAKAVHARIVRFGELYVDEADVAKVKIFAEEVLAEHLEAKVPDAAALSAFAQKRARWRAVSSEQLNDVLVALFDAADDWMARSLVLAVDQGVDEKGFVDVLEDLFDARGDGNQVLFSLAKFHRIRGARLAKEGANASAALFHLERAVELDPTMEVASLIALAKSTRGKLKPMSVSLSLSSGAEATPDTLAPIYYISALNLIEKTRDGVRWMLAEPESNGADVTLFFQKTERHVPSIANLSVVNSRYFAHMQTVPNPQKGYLQGQLNSAEISYQYALSSYNSAVTAFNIYPTQYALNSVNYAENNLERARTHYNTLVSLYNATPSTIEEPVYMPYSYYEGNMRCGYAAAGRVLAQGVETQFASRRVDSHYVRLNTKYTDINAASRRDVHYPVANISEQLFDNIFAVANDITAKVAAVRILPRDEFIGNLSEGELGCLAFAMHPLRKPDAAGLGVPRWAARYVERCRFEGVKVVPPEQALANCPLPMPEAFDAPDSIDTFRGMVCRIDCRSAFGNSTGSGSIISGDGLILTAAHVIRGSDNKVVFNSGPHKGQFESEIVFVDDRNDVAILRAKGLTARRWFNVRLGAFPPAGEAVMAIGYPGKPSSGDATQDFITKGIISASNSSKGWLVADLTVASGNSGGPIISAKTGELIGVVSQVISASIKKDYASSGYWCKAFPSARLGEALGLKPGP